MNTVGQTARKIPDHQETRLSMATENYLLSIFRLQEQGARVTPARLADHLKTLPIGEGLGTSLASVGAMIRRMARESLVTTDKSNEVALTNEGREFAESIVRRHRLAERMVVDLLGMELHKSHVEAHRLEHAISPELEEKIVVQLGNPTTCPFGHPIPGSGYVPPQYAVSLERCAPEQEMVIDRIPEDDQPLLEYLVENELIPGAVILIKETAMPRGVITLVCNDNQVAFSYEVASKIWVRPQAEGS